MKKLKLYIETSVWSHLVADDAPEARRTAEALFADVGAYEICVSDLVFQEIGRTRDETKRRMLRDLVERHQPEILISDEEEVVALAKRYIAEGVILPSARDDAIHVATAVVEGVDVLVSLNMRHIVHVRTRRGINGINKMEGYREIEIATPEEVATHGEE